MTKYMRDALKEGYRKNVIIAAENIIKTGATALDIGIFLGYEGSDLDDFIEEVEAYLDENEN